MELNFGGQVGDLLVLPVGFNRLTWTGTEIQLPCMFRGCNGSTETAGFSIHAMCFPLM